MNKVNYILIISIIFSLQLNGQDNLKLHDTSKSKPAYKKRVLETIEMDILSSYYTQDGENAAVSGGKGTESLKDVTATIIVSIPLNEDDVLTIDAGVSAYTSASSSNVNPFDGRNEADPFTASSGDSRQDTWSSANISYSHSSDDRNKVLSGNISFATEYDYNSVGIGGSYSILSNEKNTEYNIKASAYFDRWSYYYPAELKSFGLLSGEDDDDDHFNINNYTITGNLNYAPQVTPLSSQNRNSYAAGLGFSQILSEKIQGSLALDVVLQKGLLSTPFQRVYFQDVQNSYIENFHLADDIERLPSSRVKVAIGGRLHYYLNEALSLRTFYRYYKDDWQLDSHTASVELPIKLYEGQLTFYPSYRFYNQSSAEHFAPYNEHLSTSTYYTSDYDLSKYNSHQYGIGIGYNDLYDTIRLGLIDLHSIDIKYYQYHRNTTFNSHLVTLGVKFKLF